MAQFLSSSPDTGDKKKLTDIRNYIPQFNKLRVSMAELSLMINDGIENLIKPLNYGDEISFKRLPIDVATMLLLITIESSWNPNAVSGLSAYGLTQFTEGLFNATRDYIAIEDETKKSHVQVGYGSIQHIYNSDKPTVYDYIRNIVLMNLFPIQDLVVQDLCYNVTFKLNDPNKALWELHNSQINNSNPIWREQLLILFLYVNLYRALNYWKIYNSAYPYVRVVKLPPSLQLCMLMLMYNGGLGKAANIIGYDYDNSAANIYKHTDIDSLRYYYYRRKNDGSTMKDDDVRKYLIDIDSTHRTSYDKIISIGTELVFLSQQRDYLVKYLFLYQKWFNWMYANGYLKPLNE